MNPVVQEELGADPDAAARARSVVRQALELWGLADDEGIAELLASELVTNAIEHAATPVLVKITFDTVAVRVEIIDTGNEMPGLVEIPEAGGYGLSLVDRLASRWGIEQVPDHGKNVWFELDIDSEVGAGTHN